MKHRHRPWRYGYWPKSNVEVAEELFREYQEHTANEWFFEDLGLKLGGAALTLGTKSEVIGRAAAAVIEGKQSDGQYLLVRLRLGPTGLWEFERISEL